MKKTLIERNLMRLSNQRGQRGSKMILMAGFGIRKVRKYEEAGKYVVQR